MLFSVIIPTRHRNDLLAKCLDRLDPSCQTTTAAYEVIVSDDGSDSTAAAMIQENYAWVKWVAGPCQGPAANRNHGASYAQAEWLVFTDDDCLPEPDWLESYATAIAANPGILAYEGAIHPIGDVNQDAARCPVNLTGGHFWSANVVVQKELFNQINGFDPTYPLAAHEDQDIKIRLSAQTEIKFVAAAKVFHPVRIIPLRRLIFDVPKRGRAWAHHFNKHKAHLGCKTRIDIVRVSFTSQSHGLIRNLIQHRFRDAIGNFLTITVGTPLIMAYLLRSR
jgi:glycosyltransferase involved in cell wall biosynthesis